MILFFIKSLHSKIFNTVAIFSQCLLNSLFGNVRVLYFPMFMFLQIHIRLVKNENRIRKQTNLYHSTTTRNIFSREALTALRQSPPLVFRPFIPSSMLKTPNIISILRKTCAAIQSQLVEPIQKFSLLTPRTYTGSLLVVTEVKLIVCLLITN